MSLNVKLIGLAGPARVGKSTTAVGLAELGYVEKAFADPLKEALITLTGLGRKYFYDQKYKFEYVELIGMTPRTLMQLFGTEFVRERVRRDFWVERMKQRLFYSAEYNAISDVRFEDEADLIRRLGGQVVVLSRDGIEDSSGHKSEEGLKPDSRDMYIHLPNGVEEAQRHTNRILGEI